MTFSSLDFNLHSLGQGWWLNYTDRAEQFVSFPNTCTHTHTHTHRIETIKSWKVFLSPKCLNLIVETVILLVS